MNFVAIDFETANQYPQSACSVGLVKFDCEGNVIDTYYRLIKPPKGFDTFFSRNIEIHGIRPSDVAEEHMFDYIWPDVEYFIGEDFLVAHNAPFDMNVLRSLLCYFDIEKPEINYFCSLQISRRVWPNLPSHALTYLSEHFDLKYHAHNALDDAVNCGRIFLKACNGRLTTLTDLRKYLIVRGVEIKKI